MTRRRSRGAATPRDAERQARLEAALRAMLQDCPVPDRLRDLVENLDKPQPPPEPETGDS